MTQVPSSRHGHGQLFYYAGRNDLGECQRRLLAGDDPDGIAGGMTPLHVAAKRGHAAMVALLLEHGADATAVDESGTTALLLAKQNGHPFVAGVLRVFQTYQQDIDETEGDGEQVLEPPSVITLTQPAEASAAPGESFSIPAAPLLGSGLAQRLRRKREDEALERDALAATPRRKPKPGF